MKEQHNRRKTILLYRDTNLRQPIHASLSSNSVTESEISIKRDNGYDDDEVASDYTGETVHYDGQVCKLTRGLQLLKERGLSHTNETGGS